MLGSRVWGMISPMNEVGQESRKAIGGTGLVSSQETKLRRSTNESRLTSSVARFRRRLSWLRLAECAGGARLVLETAVAEERWE